MDLGSIRFGGFGTLPLPLCRPMLSDWLHSSSGDLILLPAGIWLFRRRNHAAAHAHVVVTAGGCRAGI